MNYKEIIENKKKKLDKNEVLIILRENKSKCKTYSIKEINKEKIKKEENEDISVKNKILNVINLYNQNNIRNEWEKNRKEWYQNNQRFNPIFKINERTNEERLRNNNNPIYDSTTIGSKHNNGGGGDGPNGDGGNGSGRNNNLRGNNEQDLFTKLRGVHSNQ